MSANHGRTSGRFFAVPTAPTASCLVPLYMPVGKLGLNTAGSPPPVRLVSVSGLGISPSATTESPDWSEHLLLRSALSRPAFVRRVSLPPLPPSLPPPCASSLVCYYFTFRGEGGGASETVAAYFVHTFRWCCLAFWTVGRFFSPGRPPAWSPDLRFGGRNLCQQAPLLVVGAFSASRFVRIW